MLVVQTLLLLHHRLAKRHISFAEVAVAASLCMPPTTVLVHLAWLVGIHLTFVVSGVLLALMDKFSGTNDAASQKQYRSSGNNDTACRSPERMEVR